MDVKQITLTLKEIVNEEADLIAEIEKIESNESPANSKILKIEESKLRQIREMQLTGHMIRARVQN